MSAPKHSLTDSEVREWECLWKVILPELFPGGTIPGELLGALVRLERTTQDARFELLVSCDENRQKMQHAG